MPMMGLPDWSSASDRPKFMYRSRYSAVMSAFAGSSNQARERRVRADEGAFGGLMHNSRGVFARFLWGLQYSDKMALNRLRDKGSARAFAGRGRGRGGTGPGP